MFTVAVLALVLLIDSGSPVPGCGMTKEYAELRSEAFHVARKDYESCRTAVAADRYWRALTECERVGGGEGVGGGCAHVAGLKSAVHIGEPDPAAHCEILKPSQTEVEAVIEMLAEERNITNRLSSQPDFCRTPPTAPPLN